VWYHYDVAKSLCAPNNPQRSASTTPPSPATPLASTVPAATPPAVPSSSQPECVPGYHWDK
jgi:hypothetical protein